MSDEIFTFIASGKAGEGVKKAGSVAAKLFTNLNRQVFKMDDYMSLIRGGHNFSVVSTANQFISSHYMKADLVVCFDKRSHDMHEVHLAEGGILVYNSDAKGDMNGMGIPLTSEAKKYSNPGLMLGVGAVAVLGVALGMNKSDLHALIKQEYPYGIEENIEYADIIYEIAKAQIFAKFKLTAGDKKRPIIFGNQAIALGAIAGGLDVYYAYPMTPASSILHYLAGKAEDFGVAVIHPENEIAVMNMAVGSSFTGAKTMVGTSGGGYALMVEGFSLAGICEAPVLCVLSMRPGPATGVPTYTAQADLSFALSAGHGEFLRIVSSPGTIEEAYYLTSEMLDLVWKFQTPGIILTEKHLSESSMTVDIDVNKAKWAEGLIHEGPDYKRYLETSDGISPMLYPPSNEIIKWNSYEHDDLGITTESPEWIVRMHDKRLRKKKALKEYLRNKKTVNTYGEGPINIFCYGSTTMSVLEAIKHGNIEARVIQPIYLNPFPKWELIDENVDAFHDNNLIVVEQSSTGQFTRLLKNNKFRIGGRVLQYDGRPFDPIELSEKIKEAIKYRARVA